MARTVPTASPWHRLDPEQTARILLIRVVVLGWAVRLWPAGRGCWRTRAAGPPASRWA